MAMTGAMILTSNFPNFLQPNLDHITSETKLYPDIVGKVCTIKQSNKKFETTASAKFLPKANLIFEGDTAESASMSQAYLTTFMMQMFGISYTITKQAFEDNLYQDVLDRVPAIAQALHETEQVRFAEVTDNGFSDIGSDGVPLFSTRHPNMEAGTYANTFSSPVDLSESSFQNAIVLGQNMRTYSGLRMTQKTKALYIGQDNQFVAGRMYAAINNGRMSTGDNDMDINATYLPGEQAIMNIYLSLPRFWSLLYQQDLGSGFKYYLRNKLDIVATANPLNSSTTVVGTKRFAVGIDYPKIIVGSFF